MIKKLLIICVIGFVGCKQVVPDKVETESSGTVKTESTVTVEITASLRVIDQLKTLCLEQLAPVVYPTPEEKSKAVADCVFEHLATIGSSTSALTDYVSTYCGAGANLSGLTPEQIASVQQTCTALGN